MMLNNNFIRTFTISIDRSTLIPEINLLGKVSVKPDSLDFGTAIYINSTHSKNVKGYVIRTFNDSQHMESTAVQFRTMDPNFISEYQELYPEDMIVTADIISCKLPLSIPQMTTFSDDYNTNYLPILHKLAAYNTRDNFAMSILMNANNELIIEGMNPVTSLVESIKLKDYILHRSEYTHIIIERLPSYIYESEVYLGQKTMGSIVSLSSSSLNPLLYMEYTNLTPISIIINKMEECNNKTLKANKGDYFSTT